MTPEFVTINRNHWASASGTAKGVTATANADGTLTMAGASTGEASVFSVSVDTMEPGKTYTAHVDKALSDSTQAYLAIRSYDATEASKAVTSFGSGTLGLTKTFQVPADSTRCVCMLYTATAGDVNAGTYRIQVNEGSDVQTWFPPGVEPTPRVPGGDGFGAGIHHLSDFGQCIASRDTGSPEKKSATKTVPYMSGFYDFSKIYGAIAFESREVSYSIELVGDRDELQAMKSDLMDWLLKVHDEPIYDDDILGWHFVGSADSVDWSESEDGESGTIEVTFLSQPFLVADAESSQTIQPGQGTIDVAGQPATAYASVADGTGSITIGGVKQSVGTQPTRLISQLMPGANTVTVEGAAVTVTWHECRA